MLSGPLPVWDIERRPIEIAPLTSWVFQELRTRGKQARDLGRLHREVDAAEARRLAALLSEASRAKAIQRVVHAAIVAALPEIPWRWFAVQSVTHFRILVPGDDVAPVPLHTDHGIGHPLDERNLWIPLTVSRRSGALRLLPLQQSIPFELARQHAGQLLIDPQAPARHCEADPGEMLLFTPAHVHGASVVHEDATRVSIDIRIAPRESAFARNRCLFVSPQGVP